MGNEFPTYSGDAYQNSSILDLTFVHNSLILRFSRYVGSDIWGSDHFPIFIESSSKSDKLIIPGKRFKFYSFNIDWSLLQTIMDRDIKNLLFDTLDTESLYSFFFATVEKAIKKDSPHNSGTAKNDIKSITRPSCFWWNKECNK